MLAGGIALLFLLDYSAPDIGNITSSTEMTAAPVLHFFWEKHVGFICTLLAVVCSFLRKVIGRKLSMTVGGSRSLHALALPIAGMLAFPLAFYEYLGVGCVSIDLIDNFA